MTFKTAIILTLSATALFAVNAHAADNDAQTPSPELADAASANSAVMTAASQGYIRVIDEDGNVFYNKVVETDELQSVELDAEIIDTYSCEYEGRTYTNKIVK